MSIDDQIRRAAGRLPSRIEPLPKLEGLDGGQRTPREPEPFDMDKLIRAQARGASSPTRRYPNGVPGR